MSIEKPSHLQTAMVMDRVTLAKEDSVCELLQEACQANGWDAETEWSKWDSRERIDLLAVRPPLSSIIFEAKKGYSASNFPDHVAQAARYRMGFNVAMAKTYHEQTVGADGEIVDVHTMGAAMRSRRLGSIVGALATNEVLLVCPGFTAGKLQHQANWAAEQGVLAVNVQDAVRYVIGVQMTGPNPYTYSTYTLAKHRLAAPVIEQLLSSV